MEKGFNTKRFLITLGFVLLTAIVVGGTTWYMMGEQKKDEVAVLESKIAVLEQVDECEECEICNKADEEEKVTGTTSYDDYQSVLAAAVEDRSDEAGKMKYIVSNFKNDWAVVEFRTAPDEIGFATMTVIKKDGQWLRAMYGNQGGEFKYYNGFTQADISALK